MKLQIKETQLTNYEHQQLNRMLGYVQMKEYFNQINQTTNLSNHGKTSNFLDETESKLNQQIKAGNLQITQNQNDIRNLLMRQKLSKQEQKMYELKANRMEIVKELQYLNSQVSQKPLTLTIQKSLNVLSKEDHERLMHRLMKEKAKRDKKHEQGLIKLKNEIETKQKNKLENQIAARNKSLTQRRNKIAQNQAKRKQQHQKIVQQERQTEMKYKELKNKRFLHQQIEERFKKQYLEPTLEERKKKLKQIRDITRAFNINQINNHQRDYLYKRSLKESNIQEKPNDNWSYKPPQKTQKLSRLFEEEQLELKRNLEEKKRQIQEKISRQHAYIEQLRERHIPHIDPKKKQQLQLRIAHQISPKREQSDPKITGMQYLEQSKKMGRKSSSLRSQTEKTHGIDSQDAKTNKILTNYLEGSRSKQQYQQLRRKRIQNVSKSTKNSKNQKLKKLQIEADKIAEQVKRKQVLMKYSKNEQIQNDAVQLILSSIRAKMGLIDVYKSI